MCPFRAVAGAEVIQWIVTFSAHEDLSNSRTVRVRAFTAQQACDKVAARVRELTRTEKPIYVAAIEDR
jgi:hypothetical protein